MKVKVSKTFAAFINRVAKELGFKCEASVVSMAERGYRLNLGLDAAFDAEENGDFNWTTGEYKAIRIAYPSDYYAMSRYITTAQLTREFRRCHVTDETGLKDMVRTLCEI